MAGMGPPPKADRLGKNKPTHEWQTAPGIGWQHGEVPNPPTGMRKATKDAWTLWFGSWYAAFWTPEDVPALRQLARVYDEVEQGATQRHGELRLAMETWGMTRKGQMQNRWLPPSDAAAAAPKTRSPKTRHLRAVKPGAVAGA